jgi:SPP1 gp7 family putative phage head morphogenesis protein
MIKETYKDLREGASKGWGQDFNTLDGDKVQQDKTVVKLHQNLYRFSGAKTAAQTYEINKLLYTEDGQIRPKTEFMKLVLQLNSCYNKNYLETEYNTAVKAAAMARQWENFQQDTGLFPNLKYKTVGDDRVRPEHDKLNGTIKPLNDDFWSKYYPPNGWNCRCYVVQTAENETEGTEDDTVPVEFYGNVGKDQVIFSKGQTYFQVARELGEEEFARHFERAKLEAPYLTVKGVKVNIWADLEDYKENLDTALVLHKAGYDVKIRPHVDGSVLLNTPNPEYLIEGKLADRKAPKGVNLRNILTKANKQGCEIVVLHLQESGAGIDEIKKELYSRFRFDTNYPSINEALIITKDEKVISVKRSEIKKR